MAAPGLELLFDLVSPDFSRPQDPLICFIHWELISRGLRCLGRGEQAGTEERSTERLPKGWAENKELYTLRYGRGSVILLKALTVEGTLIVNVMDLQTEKVGDLSVDVSEFIDSSHLQEYDRVYKNPSELRRRLHSELLIPLLDPKSESQTTEPEHERHPEHDPLRVPPRIPASPASVWTDPLGRPPYGAADLDPLGGHSGGMIMDPFRTGRGHPRNDPRFGLPPGAVPPGARFDPFGPIGSGRPGPDPDHLPPPGYDDMFM
ncbi:LOW QUALITY PROTEIN: proteasome inhibitor PI31 subunit [Rhinophrynus dorsalis]